MAKALLMNDNGGDISTPASGQVGFYSKDGVPYAMGDDGIPIALNASARSEAVLQYHESGSTGSITWVASTWTVIPINTEVSDVDGIVAITTSGKFKPVAGDYELDAFVTIYSNNNTEWRLWNATTSAYVAHGSNLRAVSANSVMTIDYMQAHFVANGTDEFRLEINTQTNGTPTNGLGDYDAVYASMRLRKVG